MALQQGTLIFLEYTGKVRETQELIETTSEDEAKKHNVHDPTRKYSPRLISVGEGWIVKGVDDELASLDVGESKSIEVPPGKGFGERDPSKVRMIPLRRFGDRASELKVGEEVEIDNRIGTVRFIGSGRAQVDFNHRLASRNLLYEVKVVKKVESVEEKAMALITRRLPLEESKLGIAFEGDALRVSLPREIYLAEGLQIIKQALANELTRFISATKKVEFVETYESLAPAPEKVAEKKEEVKAEEPKPTAT